MTCLLIRLKGPLQSWGYRSRFKDRDTGLEPTKSGVIGLLSCALGKDRSESPEELRALTMHVRIDSEGILLTDYQTAGAGIFRGSSKYFPAKSSGGLQVNAVLMDKHYLQDADFLVALEGPTELLDKLENSLIDPSWPLSLGRRSCPPSEPVFIGRRNMPGFEALIQETWPDGATKLRFVRELAPGDFSGTPISDVPLEWPDRQTRKYATRYIRNEMVEAP